MSRAASPSCRRRRWRSSSIATPRRTRSVSKTPSPSWKPRSVTDSAGPSAGTRRPSTQATGWLPPAGSRTLFTAPPLRRPARRSRGAGRAALARVSSHSAAASLRQVIPPPTWRVRRRPSATNVRIRIDDPIAPAASIHRAAPQYGPRRTGSSASMSSIARIFGAPVTEPPGKAAARRSNASRPGASRPVIVETRCCTLGVPLEPPESRGAHAPRPADPSEVVAQDVHDHRVLGAVLGADARSSAARSRSVGPGSAPGPGPLDRVGADAPGGVERQERLRRRRARWPGPSRLAARRPGPGMPRTRRARPPAGAGRSPTGRRRTGSPGGGRGSPGTARRRRSRRGSPPRPCPSRHDRSRTRSRAVETPVRPRPRGRRAAAPGRRGRGNGGGTLPDLHDRPGQPGPRRRPGPCRRPRRARRARPTRSPRRGAPGEGRAAPGRRSPAPGSPRTAGRGRRQGARAARRRTARPRPAGASRRGGRAPGGRRQRGRGRPEPTRTSAGSATRIDQRPARPGRALSSSPRPGRSRNPSAASAGATPSSAGRRSRTSGPDTASEGAAEAAGRPGCVTTPGLSACAGGTGRGPFSTGGQPAAARETVRTLRYGGRAWSPRGGRSTTSGR